ncbi:TonB-dependent receptor [Peristeroidobacter soli]|uniref:TonB-dependent receptor n=1 Tax=Peristeroidobacter soli TaxID=2497877 RepID=UPI00101DF70F|nr:TonB-dependent receptor [Peristeroidobacter soli]
MSRKVAYALLAASCGITQVQAQNVTSAEDSIDEVVVTGYRGALQNSIAEKRGSDQIMETISAEDIGKLPDNSIAESLARAPGLTTQRLDGRAQVISIRGLAPDFATTLLNGREQVTTGDNRSAEYDQYPAELLSAVSVYKTPQASLIGQGLSGTVDLRTTRPLAYGKRTLAGNVRGETLSLGKLNAGSEDTGYRASGTYIDQFANDKVGIAIGIAHMMSPTQIEKFNTWGYPTVDGVLGLGGVKPYVVSTELKRTGVMATLEFQPSENFNTVLDVYYSKFKDDQLLRGIELPLLWGGATLQPGYTVTNGVATSGTFSNVKGVIRNDANRRDADLWSVGWNAKLDVDKWAFTGDVNYSTVDRRDIILETYSGTGRPPSGATDTLSYNINSEGVVRFNSGLDYANANQIFLTSPQGWGGNAIAGGQDGFINSPNIKDELTALRISASRELDNGLLKAVDVGVNYTTRDKDYNPDRYFLGLVANASDPQHDLSVSIPSGSQLRPTRLGYIGIPGMVSYDPIALAYSGIYNLVPAADAAVYSREWSVGEDVLTGFAMLRLDSLLGNSALTGNLGVQFVRTEQDSSGFGASGDPAQPFPLDTSQSYTETLPSLNLSLRMADDLILRLGAARQLARPRMDEMRASISFTYDNARAGNSNIEFSPWGGEGGNPKLKPWIADAVDLSVEKYFGREGYVSGSLYFKDLKSYIYTQAAVYDFSTFPVTGGPEPVLRQGYVTTPQNGDGGEIYGYELAATIPFGMAWAALEGFGFQASYSLTKSNIQPDPTNPKRPIPGLSEDVINATVYFERAGFSTRLSARHRSSFIAEVQGVGAERLLRMAKGETLIDAQMSYEFQEGTIRGLTLLLQGTNLTDEPFITHELNDSRQVIDHQIFGRRYLFGASYKY